MITRRPSWSRDGKSSWSPGKKKPIARSCACWPIKDGAEKLLVLRRVPTPAPTEPGLEEFVSPLQSFLKERLSVKQDIGYNATCVNCSRHMNIDAEMRDKVDTTADPEPWLAQLHGELISTRQELAVTRQDIRDSKEYYTPSNRMKWAAYGAAASGTTGVALILIRYATEWAINNLPTYLPFLVYHLLGIL